MSENLRFLRANVKFPNFILPSTDELARLVIESHLEMKDKTEDEKRRFVAQFTGFESPPRYQKTKMSVHLSREVLARLVIESDYATRDRSEDEKRRLVAAFLERQEYAGHRSALGGALQRGIRRTTKRPPSAPYVGRFLICLFLQPDKQEDRLADFEEKLNKVWIPQFGNTVGQVVYVCHAIRSAGAIAKIGLTAAIVDRITRAFGW